MFGDEIFFNQVVTVWNRRKATKNRLEAQEVWYPTVISNVRLLVTRGNNIIKSGLESADSARLHILDGVSIESKTFKNRVEWDALTDDEAQNFWTLDSDNYTFFVEGDLSGISVVPNFFEEIKKSYNNCFRISSVDRFELIPHWEVWGK